MKPDMYSVYTHKTNGKQLYLNKKEFFLNVDIRDAKDFLKQIKDSFWEANRCRPRGAFYSGLRYCFAEIDMLGKFYKGEVSTQKTAENSIAFIKKYMGSVNERYQKLGGLIIDMYRHGLMHTHMIKQVKLDNGDILGWELQDNESSNEHLILKKTNHGYNLVINVYQFIKDFLSALDKYKKDLINNRRYLANFKKGYFGMAVAFYEPNNQQQAGGRKIKKKFKMKQYSYQGLQFLKKEMK